MVKLSEITEEDQIVFKAIALGCASMSWSGISSLGNRTESILGTADEMLEWLLEEND